LSGNFYQKKGYWERAGQSFEAARSLLLPEPGGDNLNPVQLKRTPEAMSKYCRQQYHLTKDPDWLRKSNALAAEAMTVLSRQVQNASSQDKSNYAAQTVPLLETKLANDRLLSQLTDSIHYQLKAFDSAERNKGILLYEAIRESNAMKMAGIPDSLLQRRREDFPIMSF
jgi:hypothetical protein